MKIVDSFNVQIWVGLRVGYSDVIYTLDDVRKIVDDWCNITKQCVTITPTEYRYVNGFDDGVIIGFINYPRFPNTTDGILSRAMELGELLRVGLQQNRISIASPTQTYMLGDEDN